MKEKFNIGFVGLGKLGLPCALAIESKGHNVFAYDINKNIEDIFINKKLPYRELWADEYLINSNIKISSLADVVKNSDIIFVPIQTPHNEKYEGVTRLPNEKSDFNYDYLIEGMKNISKEVDSLGEDKVVIIISTVLPGTIRREILPIISKKIKLCYNPFFIAMGTTIRDFLYPEFVLFGVEDNVAAKKAEKFYKTLHDKTFYKCTVEEAELIKVSYNTYITMKICLANTIMEVSHKLKNINCDSVMRGLFLAKERLISDKYLIGGMGDGGGCHPRDNIALSWLSDQINLSFDWYENLMLCREKQTEWLSELIICKSIEHKLPIVILGKCFKKETNLTLGSPSILLKNIIIERGHDIQIFDPHVDNTTPPIQNKSIFFIGTNHDVFKDYVFPEGSIIIDPWRFMPDRPGVELIKVGISK